MNKIKGNPEQQATVQQSAQQTGLKSLIRSVQEKSEELKESREERDSLGWIVYACSGLSAFSAFGSIIAMFPTQTNPNPDLGFVLTNGAIALMSAVIGYNVYNEANQENKKVKKIESEVKVLEDALKNGAR